eukprot:13066504-Ditylum_brightwellii.AAC.1
MQSLFAGVPLRGWSGHLVKKYSRQNGGMLMWTLSNGLDSMLVWNALETSSRKSNMASAAAMASRNLIFSKKLVGANDASKSIP